MVRWIGHNVGRLGKRHLVMPMKKVGAESGDGASMVKGHCPEAPYVISSLQLFFIHEPEGTGEGLREGNAAGSETFGQSLGEKFQHIAAPGEPCPIFRSIAGREEFCLPFSKIVFDGMAQMFGSKSFAMVHGAEGRAGTVPVRRTERPLHLGR